MFDSVQRDDMMRPPVSDAENDFGEARHSAFWRALIIGGGLCFLLLQAILFYRLSGAGSTAAARPDILLVTFDTLRADHCSAYGYHRTTTPTIAQLARGGVRFDNAYAPMATTAPSHATILTSLHPLAHGVIRNGFVLADKHQTLAEILEEEGYATAAFVSSFVLFNKFGCAQGFDVYDDDFSETEPTQRGSDEWQGVVVPGGKVDRRADATTERALKWLASMVRPAGKPVPQVTSRKPVFLWVHYMDPHEPYEPPQALGDPFGADEMAAGGIEQVIARYDEEIAFADIQLKRLVDQFQARGGHDGALIIVTADHGEAFVEHGWRGHGPQIYEEAVRVPLVIHWADRIRGRQNVTSPVGLVDLAPTILGLCRLTHAGTDFAGIDLSPAIINSIWLDSNRPQFFQRRLYDEAGTVKPIPLPEFDGATFGRGIRVDGHKFGVRVATWKYLEALEEEIPRELYNLKSDPAEQLNLAADHPERAERMSHLIAQWRRLQSKRFHSPTAFSPGHPSPTAKAMGHPSQMQEVTPQDRAVLEALGYVDAEPDSKETPKR